MKRILLLICCVGLLGAARGQTTMHYWFDTNSEVTSSVQLNASNHATDIDVDQLTEGLHTINIMVEDKNGLLSSPVSRTFHRSAIHDGSMRYHCWFDNDAQNAQSGDLGNGNILLDVSHLKEGLHNVFIQVYGDFVTAPQSYTFLKVPNVVGNDNLVYVCFVDDKLYTQQTVSGLQNIIHIDMDVAQLSQGMHKVQVMLATESGAVTGLYSTYFYRTLLQSEISVTEMMYAIDGKKMPPATATTATDGKLHFDVDVSSLSDGLHCINYALVGGDGVYGTSSIEWFYKIPVGGEGITSYEYWLNDDEAHMRHVDLAEHVNSYQLVSLLPVDTVPVHSMRFHFAYKNDTIPVVYAKNDFHVRFWESGGTFALAHAQYIDERVCDTIYADSLLTKNTIVPPQKNQIQWYRVLAKRGDSLAIKANKACLLQIFSPSGEEVYSADASHSIGWGGIYTREAGVFYIAMHDVMDANATSITLFSEHIDRYALLKYTPNRIGKVAGNIFTMNFDGNGFDKLIDAYLQKDNAFIHTDTIYNVTRTNASVLMSFSEEYTIPEGLYDLVLVYKDSEEVEQLIRKKAISIEEPSYGNITVRLSPAGNVVSPYRAIVNITNTGNVCYSWTPLNIAFDRPDLISDIEFANFSVAVPMTIDTLGYQFGVITQNLLGKHKDGVVFFLMIPQLLPYETKELELKFYKSSNEVVNLYAWTGTPVETDPIFAGAQSPIRKDPPDVIARNILSAGDYAKNRVTGYIPNLHGYRDIPNPASVGGTIANNALKTGVTIAGISNAADHTVDKRTLENAGVNPYDPIYETIMNLHPPIATPGQIWGGRSGELLDLYMGYQMSCATQCNPNPGNPLPMVLRTSSDPNDIIGYTSEANSKFMRQDIETVDYTIEFENDAMVATAAAHTVVIRDTLDATRFDLSSFEATEVTIGDRQMKWETAQSGIQTLDLRTRANVIAEVSLEYDNTAGIAIWTITSLDPMTMEPITDPDIGVLPINYDGNGTGTVSFRVHLKKRFQDGTKIANRAAIIFDSNAPLLTPEWVNTIDACNPLSQIIEVTTEEDSLLLQFEASDNRSGIWYYSLYAREDADHEWQLATQSESEICSVPQDWTEFYVVATDSAGNAETKEDIVEYSVFNGLLEKRYVVIFYDEDGESVLDARLWMYGAIPTCQTPLKEDSSQYSYTFAGWIPEVTQVTGNAAYIASYASSPITTILDHSYMNQKPQKVIRDAHIYILLPDGQSYNIFGEKVE